MKFKQKHRLHPKGKKALSLAAILGAAAFFPALFLSLPGPLSAAQPWASQASGNGSITNTRHNLTQSFMTPPGGLMILGRNDYQEVCVYCHTPHGSNQAEPNLPLWNHTIPDKNSFTTYQSAALNYMEGTVTTPGPASLTCLSCHDGTIAIDSIINMPTTMTSSGYGGTLMEVQTGAAPSPAQLAQLSTWSGPAGTLAAIHMSLGSFTPPGTPGGPTSCQFCHYDGNPFAPDFGAFSIGKDLTNDHPVGVTYPVAFGPTVDFKPPSDTTADGRIKYFEDAVGGSGAPSTNVNNKLNTNEIRLYDSGDGFEVECASCHDPHGVPSNGSTPWSGSGLTPGLGRSGVQFNTSFLRISNSDSDVCLTCHDK